jgi:hypothetical protein
MVDMIASSLEIFCLIEIIIILPSLGSNGGMLVPTMDTQS